MTSRRFLLRWSARLLRREWRQHAVIIGLLAVGVAIGVGSLVAVFNLAEPPDGTYGTGQVRASVIGDNEAVRAALIEQDHRFGLIETATLPVPGSAVRVTVRAQQPDDEVARPLLDLVAGRWPDGDAEVAVTDGVARRLGLAEDPVGQTVELGTDTTVTIVGRVENPTDLDDEFALVDRLDPFGLEPVAVTSAFLVDAEPREVVFPGGVAISVESSGSGVPVDTRTALTLLVNLATLLALLETVLLAGAGFAVVARRRSRQYGLLGAIGAAPAQIRRAATAGGVLVGWLGAGLGVVAGVAIAALIVPRLDETVGHRIDFTVPWWTVVPTVVVAIVAAGLAARWPSRSLSRQPVAVALAARRPRSGPIGRLALVGVVVAPAGLALLAIGVTRLAILPALIGVVVAFLGLLLVTPAVVSTVARVGRGLPLPGRLAARSHDRQRGRSAAVVGALVVAIGLPIGLVAVTGSIDRYRAAQLPNLADDLAVAWLPGAEDPMIEIPVDLDPTAAAAAVDRLGAALPSAQLVPIEVAVAPDQVTFSAAFESLGMAPSVMPAFGVIALDEPCLVCDQFAFGDRDENGDEIVYTGHDAWIATPALLDALAFTPTVDPDQAPTGLTRLADVRLVDDRQATGATGLVVEPSYPALASVAPVLLWPDAAEARGWETRTIGWLIAGDGVAAADRAGELVDAAGSALLLETRVEPEPTTALRLVALLVGGLTGLSVLAAAVALEVAEGAGDRAILLAIGAGPGTARRISAAGAVILALTGAMLAVPTGYLALLGLLAVPGLDLPFVVAWSALALALALPALAWIVGWVGAGRGDGTRAGLGRLGTLPALVPILLLAAATLAAGCGIDRPWAADDDGGDARSVAVDGGAADTIGCDPALDAAFEAWAEAGFSGSVAIVGGPRSCVAAYGLADRADDRANTVDTVFSIGSVTKAVTAAAILDLVDQEVLGFEDPVGRYRPELVGPVADLTIRQLLLHTSGLVGEHGDDHVALGEGDAVAAIGALDLGFPAGEGYLYSNAGYTLLALVVEAVTEQGYRDYIRDEILTWGDGEPVGGFWDGRPAAPEPRAVGYPDGEHAGHAGDVAGPHWGLDGNGGLAMTAFDLARWTRALFTGEILSSRATDWLTSTRTYLGEGVELPGWVELDRSVFGELLITSSGGGGSIGHSVDVGWLPESDRVVVLAVNGDTPRSSSFVGHVVPALMAGTGVPGPPPLATASPEEIDALRGTWAVGDGALVIEPRHGGLLVEADGVEAMELLFPTPAWAAAEMADHERLAAAFVAGRTAEGARRLADLEAERGPVRSVELIGTMFDGELVTFLRLGFEADGAAGDGDGAGTGGATIVAIALNRHGGSEAFGLDSSPPAMWLAPDGEGGHGPLTPDPTTPATTLRSGGGNGPDQLIVDGPGGTTVLERVDPVGDGSE